MPTHVDRALDRADICMHADYTRTDLRPEAEASFRRMVQVLHEVMTGRVMTGRRPDLILAAGDSGQSSMALTRLVYGCVGLPVPPCLVVPLFRATDRDWRTTGVDITLHAGLARRFRSGGRVRTVLFVDDEIGSGGTFRACMELVASVDASLEPPLRVVVVAEDLWFRSAPLQNAELEFKPFGRRLDGISITSRLIPPDFEEQVRRILAPDEDRPLFWKRATNILLDLPVKELTAAGPRWTYRFRDAVASRLPGLQARQEAFAAYLNELARAALTQPPL